MEQEREPERRAGAVGAEHQMLEPEPEQVWVPAGPPGAGISADGPPIDPYSAGSAHARSPRRGGAQRRAEAARRSRQIPLEVRSRMSQRVSDIAVATAGRRTEEHAEALQKFEQQAAAVGNRLAAITNSEQKRERAVTNAAARVAAEAGVAAAVWSERQRAQEQREARADKMKARLRELARPVSAPAGRTKAARPPSRIKIRWDDDDANVSGWIDVAGLDERPAEPIGEGSAVRYGGRRGTVVGWLDLLVKSDRLARTAARSVQQRRARSRGALKRRTAAASAGQARQAKVAAVATRCARERVEAYQNREEAQKQTLLQDRRRSARRVIQSYSSTDEIRGEANKGKRARAARASATRCLRTVRRRDQRESAAIAHALAALDGRSERAEVDPQARAAAAAARAAAAQERQRQVDEAQAKMRAKRLEQISGKRQKGLKKNDKRGEF